MKSLSIHELKKILENERKENIKILNKIINTGVGNQVLVRFRNETEYRILSISDIKQAKETLRNLSVPWTLKETDKILKRMENL